MVRRQMCGEKNDSNNGECIETTDNKIGQCRVKADIGTFQTDLAQYHTSVVY